MAVVDAIKSFSNEISGILAVVGFVISIPTVIVGISLLIRFLRYKRTILQLIAQKVNIFESEIKAKMKTYEKHLLSAYMSSGQRSDNSVSVDAILKNLKKPNTVTEGTFIIGEAGYGKSTLMQYLCFRYALKTRKRGIKNDKLTLDDIGIQYIDLGDARPTDTQDYLASLIDSITDNSHTYHILFLDSFDEFRALEKHDANQILDCIMKAVLKKTDKYNRVVISTRLEPIQGGISKLVEYRFNSGNKKYPFLIYKINEFTAKQTLNLYVKKGSTSDHTDTSELKTKYKRGKYKSRMKHYLSSHKNTVFQIPVLIEFADSLFSKFRNEQLVEMKVNDIYDAIVNLLIHREYDIVTKLEIASSHNDCDDEDKYRKYKQNAFKFISLILEKMVTDNSNSISLFDINEISSNFDFLDYNDLLTRHLMAQHIDNTYEFIHHSFYEYFLAYRMLDISYSEKRTIMLNKTNQNIVDFYLHFLITDKIEMIIKCEESINYLISEGHKEKFSRQNIKVSLRAQKVSFVSKPSINIDEYINLLPLTNQICIDSCSLSGNDLLEFGENRYLDISGQGLTHINFLKYFGDIQSLDISENNIQDISLLSDYLELKNLFIQRNPTIMYSALSILRIEKLYVSITSNEQLEKVLLNEQVQEFNFDIINNYELYIHIYAKHCCDSRIKFARCIPFREYLEITTHYSYKDDFIVQLTKAIYHLEKSSFSRLNESTLFIGNRLGRLLMNYDHLESENILREVYSAEKEILGEDDINTLSSLADIGSNLLAQEKYLDSETILRVANASLKRIFGETNTYTLASGHELGRNLFSQKKYIEAEMLLREIFNVEKETRGMEDSLTLSTGQILGDVLACCEKYIEGENLLRDIYLFDKKVFGVKKSTTQQTGHVLGVILSEEKKYNEGEILLRDVYYNRLDIYGDKNTHTLKTGYELGVNLTRQNKLQEGEQILRKTYTTQREVLGDTNPDTLATILYLDQHYT